MPITPVYPQLIQLQKKNKLALQAYLLAIDSCSDNFLKKLYKKLYQEKSQLDESLTNELIKNNNKYFKSHTLGNVIVDSWFDFHLIKLFKENEVLEAVFQGEERAVQDYKEILSNDLSSFGNIRDLLQVHNFKVQKLIASLQEIS